MPRRDHTVWAGRCPTHGIIYGDDVDVQFPASKSCRRCGSELETATVADREEVALLDTEDGDGDG